MDYQLTITIRCDDANQAGKLGEDIWNSIELDPKYDIVSISDPIQVEE